MLFVKLKTRESIHAINVYNTLVNTFKTIQSKNKRKNIVLLNLKYQSVSLVLYNSNNCNGIFGLYFYITRQQLTCQQLTCQNKLLVNKYVIRQKNSKKITILTNNIMKLMLLYYNKSSWFFFMFSKCVFLIFYCCQQTYINSTKFTGWSVWKWI